MEITTLSSTLIDQRKKETVAAQNLRKSVPFRDINIIDTTSIEYGGNRISITPMAFKNLLSLLGMSQTFAKRFEELFTKEAKATFINTMKNAMASNSGNLSNVTLVLNPISKTVIGITKNEEFGISNQQFMNVAENIIDNNSMDVSNWSVDPTNGMITINAFNPKANFEVHGLSNEVFTGGVTFQNSPRNGFQVLPYVNRQWCTNGLTTPLAEEAYTLNSLDNSSMEKFFENMNHLRKNNFAPSGFGDKVRIANETPASLHELSLAHSLIEPYTADRTESFIARDENLNAYYKKGFDQLNTNQLKSAKSNTSIWDITNAVNYIASNGNTIMDMNLPEHKATELMTRAGEIFGKKQYDHENQMPNPFASQSLIRTGSLLN